MKDKTELRRLRDGHLKMAQQYQFQIDLINRKSDLELLALNNYRDPNKYLHKYNENYN